LHKIPANTLFLGKNLVFMPECHSTNSFALKLCQQSPLTADGTVVITSNQTAGRGQRGSTWQSEPGMNLTLGNFQTCFPVGQSTLLPECLFRSCNTRLPQGEGLPGSFDQVAK